jgi:hypothetical protein
VLGDRFRGRGARIAFSSTQFDQHAHLAVVMQV